MSTLSRVKSGSIVVTTLLYVFLVIVAFVVLYPVLFTLSSSFNDIDSLAATSIVPFTKVEYSPSHVLTVDGERIQVVDGAAQGVSDGTYILSYETNKLVPFDVSTVTQLQYGKLVTGSGIALPTQDKAVSLLNARDSSANYEAPYAIISSLQEGIWKLEGDIVFFDKDGNLITSRNTIVKEAPKSEFFSFGDDEEDLEEAEPVAIDEEALASLQEVSLYIKGKGDYLVVTSDGTVRTLENGELFLNSDGAFVQFVKRSFGKSYLKDVFVDTVMDRYNYKFNKENIKRADKDSNGVLLFNGYALDGSLTKLCDGEVLAFADGLVDSSTGLKNVTIVDDGLYNVYTSSAGLKLVTTEDGELVSTGINKKYSFFGTSHYEHQYLTYDGEPLVMTDGVFENLEDGDYSVVYGGKVSDLYSEEDMAYDAEDIEPGTIVYFRVTDGVPHEMRYKGNPDDGDFEVRVSDRRLNQIPVNRSATSGTVPKPGKVVFEENGYPYFMEQMDGVRQFRRLFNDTMYLAWYRNTLKIAFMNTIFTLILCVTSAYVFSRFNFSGKKPMMAGMVVLQMFPSFIGMIATYVILMRINALDTHWGLVLVYATGNIPYNTWMLKGYFDTVSKSIEEAALVDGATRLTTYVRIILPMVKPMIAFLALTSFTGPWMDFIFPRLILRSQDKMTLAVGLYDMISGRAATNFTMFAAGALLVAVPFALLFMFGQNFMVKTMASGAVKE